MFASPKSAVMNRPHSLYIFYLAEMYPHFTIVSLQKVGDIKRFSLQYWLLALTIMFFYNGIFPFVADARYVLWRGGGGTW